MEKIIITVIVILILIIVFYLTFQPRKQTIRLSESFRKIALKLGYKGDKLQFRSDVHLIEYFIVGLAMFLFANAMSWELWVGLIIACGIGLIDETVKIFLPTREFGGMDLVKDFIGIIIAYAIVSIITHVSNGK